MKKIKVITLSALAFVTIACTVLVSCQKNTLGHNEIDGKSALELPFFNTTKTYKIGLSKMHIGVQNKWELGSWSWEITAANPNVRFWYCEGYYGLCTKNNRFSVSNSNSIPDETTDLIILDDGRIALKLNNKLQTAVMDGYLTINPDISSDNTEFLRDSQGRLISGITFDSEVLSMINKTSFVILAGNYQVLQENDLKYIVLN